MLEAISITEARKDFLPLIDRVEDELYRFMVTKHGKPVAVVINYDEYSRMVETLKLLEDGRLAREIYQGATEAEQGRLIEFVNSGDNGE
ncbi:MAG: type II toxin-antitoxin system Phd/YefM family antitoxin [Dehalococcoidales bacterium]|nr:type II toxin-antitoxin system Phd/YefM family antitoxin [Dehalococcoidales bacterium]